jgi:hypothetical protein
MPHSTRARTSAGAALAVLASVVAGSLAGPAAAFPDKTVTRSNPGMIVIPEVGPAIPATSSIVVEPGFGRVSDVDVTLTGLFHACPSDVVATLLGPGGQKVVLMRKAAAGSCRNSNDPLVVTFDDEAATTIAEGTDLVAGAFRPTDNEAPDPAPLLSIFDGQSAGGTWQLALEDATGGDSGYLTGWAIEIDYNDTVVPTGMVSIGGGAATTGSAGVTLGLSASDPGADSTGIAQMRFSNDGTTWSALQPYATSTTWTLPAGDGTKTVWAQYADGIGNLSVPSSDAVVLDTTAPTVARRTPKNQKDKVSVSASVSLVASEALDATTITRRTVRLTSNGTTVHAKVAYAPDTRKVTVTPQKRLAADTTYKVKISTKVTDLAGNRMAAQRWSFITR